MFSTVRIIWFSDPIPAAYNRRGRSRDVADGAEVRGGPQTRGALQLYPTGLTIRKKQKKYIPLCSYLAWKYCSDVMKSIIFAEGMNIDTSNGKIGLKVRKFSL